MIQTWKDREYTISTDPAWLDVYKVHQYIAGDTYWAKGRSLATMEKAINNSLCFGLYYLDMEQIGFTRVITDYATYAYLADVYVDPDFRGRGLGKWLVRCALEHPELREIVHWGLRTRDAHTLYTRYGFTQLANPDSVMERRVAIFERALEPSVVK